MSLTALTHQLYFLSRLQSLCKMYCSGNDGVILAGLPALNDATAIDISTKIGKNSPGQNFHLEI